jgi:hypothetical protein
MLYFLKTIDDALTRYFFEKIVFMINLMSALFDTWEKRTFEFCFSIDLDEMNVERRKNWIMKNFFKFVRWKDWKEWFFIWTRVLKALDWTRDNVS